MYQFVVALHVILCLCLVLIIILQPGKGSDVGSAFGGGGSSTVFGPRGPAGMLAQATTGVAVMFMVTSITLAWYSSKRNLSNANVAEELLRLQSQQDAPDEPQIGTPRNDVPSAPSQEAPAPEDPADTPSEPSETVPEEGEAATP